MSGYIFFVFALGFCVSCTAVNGWKVKGKFKVITDYMQNIYNIKYLISSIHETILNLLRPTFLF